MAFYDEDLDELLAKLKEARTNSQADQATAEALMAELADLDTEDHVVGLLVQTCQFLLKHVIL